MTDVKLLGALREEDGRGVVRVEHVYATGIDDLWEAVTRPERLRRWIAEVEGDLRVGGEFRARFTSGWSGSGAVEICDAPGHLRVRTWEAGSEPTTIEAVLTSEGAGTRLVIEERGLPLAEYADHGAGWQAHAEDLEALVAGGEPGSWLDRWRELSSAYSALARGENDVTP